jgi:hypothetical protein
MAPFPRKRESISLLIQEKITMDSRFRGKDDSSLESSQKAEH